MTLYAISDSYVGVVEKQMIVLEIKMPQKKDKPAEAVQQDPGHKYHEDDLNTGMSLFE